MQKEPAPQIRLQPSHTSSCRRTAPHSPDIENAVAFLAREVLRSDANVLLIAHLDGLSAGVDAFASRHTYTGGTSHRPDGVFRSWTAQGRKVRLQVGSTQAVPVTVTARRLLASALPSFADADWDQLAELRDHWNEANHDENGDLDLWHRSTYRPAEVTAAERARLRDAHDRRWAAERHMHDIVSARLAEPSPSAPTIESPEQLELFPEIVPR